MHRRKSALARGTEDSPRRGWALGDEHARDRSKLPRHSAPPISLAVVSIGGRRPVSDFRGHPCCGQAPPPSTRCTLQYYT